MTDTTERRPTLAGAILAGGKATRYGGRNKAALDCGDGRTIARRLLGELGRAGIRDVIVCANDAAGLEALGVPIVADLRPGLGPLGGIEAALTHYRGRAEGVVLLACDLPGISARQISALADAFGAGRGRVVVAATADSFWHPLCAVVHDEILGAVSAAIDAGELGVGRLWRKLGAVEVRFEDDEPFFNVNAPEDLATWRARRRQRR